MRVTIAAAAILSLAGQAGADVVDFTDQADATSVFDRATLDKTPFGTDCWSDCRTTDGFIFNVDYWHEYWMQEGLTVDDDGVPRSFVARPGGQRFSVESLTFAPPPVDPNAYPSGTSNSIRITGSTPPPQTEAEFLEWSEAGGAYDGLLYGIYGIRGNGTVSTYEFGADGPTGEVSLPKGFRKLDALRIDLLLSGENRLPRLDPPGTPDAPWCLEDTCAHLEITSMRVGEIIPPVPLPASLPLLLAGLGALGLARRYRS